MKKRLLTIVLVFGSVALFAQSKIGSNAGTLQSGQLLELEKQGNRAGLKIAEVALTGNNDVTTVKLPSDNTKAKGTLIWNTATVAGGNAVSPGFYVWTGTLWERVNTGTVVPTVSNSSNTNSLTTTVNGVTGTAVNIINSNLLSGAANAITSTVNGVTATLSPASGTVAESLGFNAAGDLVKQTANAANTPNIYTTDGTINGDRTITIANGGTMYITGQNNSIVNSGTSTNANLRLQGATASAVLDIGNTTAAPYLQASNATDLSNSLPLLLNPNGGRVGIGNTTPAEALDVTGNVRLSGALMPGGAAGTTGQILTSAGAGAAPTWASASSLPVTVSNASSTNSLTTTVNGVTGTAVNIINSNTLTAASNTITSTVNGVTATLTPTAGGTITESLGFDSNGELVSQSTSSLSVPTFYTSNGSFDNRQVQITNGGTFYLIGQNSSVANSGTNTNANFRIQGITNVNGLDIGNTNSAPYLQSNNVNDLSSSLPLLLNPNGGNVGIGTTSPSQALDVTGNVRLSGALMPGGAAGTTGQILTSAGAGAAPTWASASSLPVTVSNASSTNSLTTTVNGVTGTAVNIINGNTLTAASNAITSTVNGVTATLTPTAGGTIAENLGFNAAGDLVRQTASAANTPNIYTADGTLTGNRTVNMGGNFLNFLSNGSGNTAYMSFGRTAVEMDQGVSGGAGGGIGGTVAGDAWLKSLNNLFVGTVGTGSINFVTGTAPGTNRMRITSAGNVGIGNTSPTERLDVTGNIRFSGALMPNNTAGTAGQVLTSAGAGAAPTWSAASNIYTADGTLTGNRTITMGSNSLNFRSNSASALAYLTYGRTATEMDMGVAGANGNGLDGTTPGDSWLAGTNNLYVGTRGTGSFRVVTGAAGSGVTRLFVNSAGSVGIGTTSPSQILDVNGVAKATRFTNGATAISGGNDFGIYNQDAANAWTRYVVQSGSHAFFTDGASGNNFYGATASMLLNSTGLGIGTGNTAASERLQVNGNIRFSGALMPNNAAGTAGQVLTSAGAGAAPTWTTPTTSQNIYNTDGTFTGARTVNMAGNFLNFLSNNAGSTAYMSFGRTAVEMDMGVSGGVGGGIGGTVAGDTWFKSLNNLFVGTIGAGSINFITGTSPGTNRMRITSAGNVGIGTTSPAYKLDVSGNGSFSGILNINGQTGQPPASGTATNAAIRVATNNADGNVLDIGTFTSPGVSGVAAYLQSTDKSNVGTGYAILLNPRGGNVGIGGFGPTQRLDVGGTIKGTNLTNGTTALSTGDFGLYSQNNNWMRYVTAGGNHMFFTDGDSNNSFSGSTAAMALTSAGRLGVGTTAPLAPLHVRGTNAQPATTGVVPTSALRIDGGTHTLDIGVLSTSPWGAYIQSANGNVSTGDLGTGMPLILQPVAGQVGIGLYSPNVKLHVANGNIAATAGGNVTSNVGGGAGTTTGVVLEQFGKISAEGDAINMTLSKPTSSFATANAYVAFLSNGAEIGKIHTTNRSTITYTTTSDVRLKENIVPTHFGLADVNKIKVYDYNFKADADKTQEAGFLAQELYKIYPQAVAVGGDDPKKNPWAVDYGKLTPLLVKAIQEQQLQIEALKKEIENLKNK
jgi:hypothetical protein